MMGERGVKLDQMTQSRWVQKYGPELGKCIRSYLKPTKDSWRVDETYVPVKGEWKYLYQAVDSQGHTLDFLLTTKRAAAAACLVLP
jgi:transposase-like protein